jgi:hypothetical protein
MTLITSTDLEFTVLGSFSTARAGGAVDLGGKLQRSVLALLVAAGGHRIGYDELLVGVWGEDVGSDLEAGVCDDTGLPAPVIIANVSVDGTEILARDMPLTLDDPGPPWEIIDPATGAVVERIEPGEFLDVIDVFTEAWFQGKDGDQVIVLDRPTRAELARFTAISPRTQISNSGERIAQADGASIMLIEVGSWDAETIEFDTDFGRVRGMGFSPNDRFFAVGADDALFIADLEQRVIVQELPVAGVSDIHWIDDGILLIGSKTGVWATVSLDPLAIGGIALETLTRGYTTEECATYGIDPCPTTLAQVMQRYGGSA